MKKDATKDYYLILGVSPTASADEIRDVYLSRMRVLHPDRFDRNTQRNEWMQANEMLAKLNEAYATLRDGAERKEYDDLRMRGSNAKARAATPSSATPPPPSHPPSMPPQGRKTTPSNPASSGNDAKLKNQASLFELGWFGSIGAFLSIQVFAFSAPLDMRGLFSFLVVGLIGGFAIGRCLAFIYRLPSPILLKRLIAWPLAFALLGIGGVFKNLTDKGAHSFILRVRENQRLAAAGRAFAESYQGQPTGEAPSAPAQKPLEYSANEVEKKLPPIIWTFSNNQKVPGWITSLDIPYDGAKFATFTFEYTNGRSANFKIRTLSQGDRDVLIGYTGNNGKPGYYKFRKY